MVFVGKVQKEPYVSSKKIIPFNPRMACILAVFQLIPKQKSKFYKNKPMRKVSLTLGIVCLIFAIITAFYGITRIQTSKQGSTSVECPTCPVEVNYEDQEAGQKALTTTFFLLVVGIGALFLGRKSK